MKAYVAEFFGTFWLVLGGAGRLTRQISFNVIFNKIVYDVCLSPQPYLGGWEHIYIIQYRNRKPPQL